MSWRFRTLSMFFSVASYYLVIFPHTSGWAREITSLMVDTGALLFVIASVIRFVPGRERAE